MIRTLLVANRRRRLRLFVEVSVVAPGTKTVGRPIVEAALETDEYEKPTRGGYVAGLLGAGRIKYGMRALAPDPYSPLLHVTQRDIHHCGH